MRFDLDGSIARDLDRCGLDQGLVKEICRRLAPLDSDEVVEAMGCASRRFQDRPQLLSESAWWMEVLSVLRAKDVH
jgi:hypothetical protein